MAKQVLPVNFKDDILSPSMGGKRRYNLIQNDDGTYSLEDVTEYTQTGSDFGAGQINATNQAVNESCDKANVIDDLNDIEANQADGMIAGAKAVAELNGKFRTINFETGSQINTDYGKFRTINFETGSQINTDYTIPLPDGWYFYNTALLSFQVTMNGVMRDGINNNAITTAHSGNYRVTNSQALNADAYVILYKYR